MVCPATPECAPCPEPFPCEPAICETAPAPRRGVLEDSSVLQGVVSVSKNTSTVSVMDFGHELLVWHHHESGGSLLSFDPVTRTFNCVRQNLPSPHDLTPFTIVETSDESHIIWGFEDSFTYNVTGRATAVGGDTFFASRPTPEVKIVLNGSGFLTMGSGRDGLFEVDGNLVAYNWDDGTLDISSGSPRTPLLPPSAPLSENAIVLTHTKLVGDLTSPRLRIGLQTFEHQDDCVPSLTEATIFEVKVQEPDAYVFVPEQLGVGYLVDSQGRKHEARPADGQSTSV